jgi:SHOCT-like domain
VVLMATDPLDQVLRLVAEGRLTADEAAPILAALDERPPADSGTGPSTSSPGEAPNRDSSSGATGSGGPAPGAASSLRIEVREAGRQVVNVRLPIAIGRLALDRVPGLSGEQVDSVRQALAGGVRGPIIAVDDGDNTVRIVLE